MPVVEEKSKHFTVEISRTELEFFSAHHITIPKSWKPGVVITAFKNALLEPYVGIFHGHYIPQWGAFTYSYSELDPLMQLGRYCSIASGVKRMGPHHGYHLISSTDMLYREGSVFNSAFADYNIRWRPQNNPQKDVPIIGHDVWIGEDAMLARGICIGDGAVIAARSVVTKDVAPYCVVAGVPAKVLKWRFSQTVIERFLAARWWQYPLPLLSHLSLDNPEKFLDEIETQTFQKLNPIGNAWDVLSHLA